MRERYIGTPQDVVEEIRVQNSQVQEIARGAINSGDRQQLVRAINEVVAINRLHTKVVRQIILKK